jgi:hypothetical protein
MTISRIVTTELEANREQLMVESSPEAAGKVRSNSIQHIASMPDGVPVLVMGFGKALVILDKEGNVLSEVDFPNLRRGWQFDPSKVCVPGSIPTNKVFNNLRFPSGIVLVVGGASTAKSPFVHLLASAGKPHYSVIRYGEPLAGYMVDEGEAMESLGRALLTESDIVFDSVKDLLAMATGGAMASGLSRGALPILSDLSALAATVGATIYIPINPSTSAENIVEMVVEAAKSNVAMTIVNGSKSGGVSNTWISSIRRGEGLLRDVVEFDAGFTEDSLIMEFFGDAYLSTANGKAKTPSWGGTAQRVSAATQIANQESFDAALRRHMTPKK